MSGPLRSSATSRMRSPCAHASLSAQNEKMAPLFKQLHGPNAYFAAVTSGNAQSKSRNKIWFTGPTHKQLLE